MCSKSYQKQEIKRSGSGILNFFYKKYFQYKKRVYYYLSFDFVWYYTSSHHQLD